MQCAICLLYYKLRVNHYIRMVICFRLHVIKEDGLLWRCLQSFQLESIILILIQTLLIKKKMATQGDH